MVDPERAPASWSRGRRSSCRGSPGYHWYLVPRVGSPTPTASVVAYRRLAAFHDELWERTGIDPTRTVLGGFSMGTGMSYALGLSGERPAPTGILALSGFSPTVEAWRPSLDDRTDRQILIAHVVMPVCSR